MPKFNANKLKRELRKAQRKEEREVKRELNKINRNNKRAVDAYNRKVKSHNKKVLSDYNRQIRNHNQTAERQNKKAIADLNRQLGSSSSTVKYTKPERILADRVHQAITKVDHREYDSFLSYARIDGSDVANTLRNELVDLGVTVWFDEVAMVPG